MRQIVFKIKRIQPDENFINKEINRRIQGQMLKKRVTTDEFM